MASLCKRNCKAVRKITLWKEDKIAFISMSMYHTSAHKSEYVASGLIAKKYQQATSFLIPCLHLTPNQPAERCLLFSYGGCGGNTNNFQSEESCISTCGGPTGALIHAIQLHGHDKSSPILADVRCRCNLLRTKNVPCCLVIIV